MIESTSKIGNQILTIFSHNKRYSQPGQEFYNVIRVLGNKNIKKGQNKR